MKENIKVARMRYQTDKRSSRLCILAIVFNIAYFLMLYSNNDLAPDMNMGLDVLYNIIFMLIAFLASEKTKAYDKKWSYIVAVVGILEILRILWVPAHYRKLEMLTSSKWMMLVAALLLAGGSLILAGLSCYKNSTTLENYLKSVEGE